MSDRGRTRGPSQRRDHLGRDLADHVRDAGGGLGGGLWRTRGRRAPRPTVVGRGDTLVRAGHDPSGGAAADPGRAFARLRSVRRPVSSRGDRAQRPRGPLTCVRVRPLHARSGRSAGRRAGRLRDPATRRVAVAACSGVRRVSRCASISPASVVSEEPFTQLLREHGGLLSRIAACYEARPSERADLSQEIAMAIWRALPRFRGASSLRTFVARIAHNRGVSHVIAQRRDGRV
ncbi:MAG: sigma-70 family RNA polymerase sigma factor, partial [Myxococcales bacterium]|nr:sigma-70 family RNA polymerase sigma factor [Myxococcales bacterium]